MIDGICSYLAKSKKPVVFDTNVFIAFIVGNWNASLLGRCKRTEGYRPEDFTKMMALVAASGGRLGVTPAILTEACNLCDNLNSANDNQVFQLLREIVATASERRKESILLCDHPSFLRLGYADASVIDFAVSGAVLVTDDLQCYLEASRLGGVVINFNHLRSQDLILGGDFR